MISSKLFCPQPSQTFLTILRRKPKGSIKTEKFFPPINFTWRTNSQLSGREMRKVGRLLSRQRWANYNNDSPFKEHVLDLSSTELFAAAKSVA